MAILKNVGLKTSTIDEIKDNFDGAQGVVVVNYSGLTVEIGRASCRERV